MDTVINDIPLGNHQLMTGRQLDSGGMKNSKDTHEHSKEGSVRIRWFKSYFYVVQEKLVDGQQCVIGQNV